MAHLAINFFFLVIILMVGWFLFFCWLLGTICKLIWRGFSRATGVGPRPRPAVFRMPRCPRLRCRAVNPPEANFCRRCGTALTRTMAVRRPAGQAPDGRFASTRISI
jgi:ribosomal protein L40E